MKRVSVRNVDLEVEAPTSIDTTGYRDIHLKSTSSIVQNIKYANNNEFCNLQDEKIFVAQWKFYVRNGVWCRQPLHRQFLQGEMTSYVSVLWISANVTLETWISFFIRICAKFARE